LRLLKFIAKAVPWKKQNTLTHRHTYCTRTSVCCFYLPSYRAIYTNLPGNTHTHKTTNTYIFTQITIHTHSHTGTHIALRPLSAALTYPLIGQCIPICRSKHTHTHTHTHTQTHRNTLTGTRIALSPLSATHTEPPTAATAAICRACVCVCMCVFVCMQVRTCALNCSPGLPNSGN